jgi:RNA polymerase sigma factor (sigma-70 family)
MYMATDPSVPSTPSGSGGYVGTFSDFYERELAGQMRRAVLLLGSREAAEDVVHESFVALYKRWRDLDSPGPYLERVVLNGCRDVYRRRLVAGRYLSRMYQEQPPVDAPLFDALSRLPFNHRAAVVLRYYHQYTEAEISAVLGCRPGSVGPWIQRALRQLAKELS